MSKYLKFKKSYSLYGLEYITRNKLYQIQATMGDRYLFQDNNGDTIDFPKDKDDYIIVEL